MPSLDIKSLALWPHQRSAVEMCDAFLKSGSKRSALVHMPTGTGKTGIMATVATRRAQSSPVLVICPSIALVHQLTADCRELFWKKIRANGDWAPEKTLQLLPSQLDEIDRQITDHQGERVIAFSTIQALQQIHSRDDYQQLCGRFGTVLFDEGHREPAPLWALAARGLGAPTILFSATPFRNDLKIFDVDSDHIHFLSFQDAVSKKLIRGVEICEIDFGGTPREFARRAIQTRDALIKSGRFTSHHKMIVRADREDDVDDLFVAFRKELRDREDGVLALHINFSLEGPVGRQRRGDVPKDLRTRPEKFLIHQFMLAEGIDDPACTMLALFEPFSTERQLVQQIGRLTRHDGSIGSTISDAYVMARRDDGVGEMWGHFLKFDDACVRNGGKPPIRNDEEVLEKLIDALPESDYVAGKFRSRLNFDEVDLEDDLRAPKSAIVFQLEHDFDFAKFDDEVQQGLKAVDRFVRRSGTFGGGNCRYHISLRMTPSPFLADALFLAPSLELTIYAQHDDKLFFYDSAGLWIENSPLKDRLTVRSLRRLLPDTPKTRVTSLTMKNTDLGPIAIKSKSMSAHSLAVSGVFVGEHLHVVTRAAGRIEAGRRAVGFVQSRVRDGEGAKWTPNEFWEWTRAIRTEIDARTREASVFQRFAAPTKAPQLTDPKNILVDLDEFTDDFEDENKSTVVFDFEHVCVDVTEETGGPAGYNHQFKLVVNGTPVTVWIKWDRKKRKYWLRSERLSEFKLRDNTRISLTRRLNQKQPFRIIIAESSTVYAYGGFYAIDLDLTRPGGAGTLVLDLIKAIPGLRTISSEKGSLKGNASSWPSDSLFGFIDRSLRPRARNKPFGDGFASLVCDDLGDEVADFIGVDGGANGMPPRVTFIAAKWKPGSPGVSASAIYDVCAQVVKNLAYLKVDAQKLPGSSAKWNRNWTLDGGHVPRIRAGSGAAAVREALNRTRSNPYTQRTTWMVLGGGILSRAALCRELAQQPPEAHVLQFTHLVLSAFAACQSVGAELQIFCAD